MVANFLMSFYMDGFIIKEAKKVGMPLNKKQTNQTYNLFARTEDIKLKRVMYLQIIFSKYSS